MLSPRGFSLIEVVVATGLLAFSIVAVIGLIGLTSRSVTDVQDYGTASQLSAAIQEELLRESFDNIAVGITSPIILYASKTGDRVVLEQNRQNDPVSGTPPGMSPRDRYFIIEISRIGNPVTIGATGAQLDWEKQVTYDPLVSSFVTLKVQVRWPHAVPLGPGTGTETDPTYDLDKQRFAVYYMTVRRRI